MHDETARPECSGWAVLCVLLCRALPPGVVNGVVPGEDDLGDGDKGVAIL